MKTISIAEVKNFLNSEIAPMAWQRIQVRLLPYFRSKGFFLHTMTDDKILDTDSLKSINTALFELYNVNLPTIFLGNQ